MIREEMDRKRADLADKLGALESQVLGTVQSASEAVGDAKEVITSVKDTLTETAGVVKETVTGTISSVKESVNDTMQSVADTLNVSRHVQNHPWAAMGCAVATGFTAGLLLGGSREEKAPASSDGAGAWRPSSPWQPAAAPVAQGAPGAPAEEEGLGGQIMDSLGGAWERLSGGLQGLAVASVLGLVKQMATSSLPQNLVGEVGRFIDDLNDKLGGKATELSESVVSYVKDAVTPSEDDEAALDEAMPGARATAPAPRPQVRNGPRQRAAR